MKREKVGAWGAAKELLNRRKNEIREGIKMPENMRQTSPRFKTFCDDMVVYSKKNHRDFRSVEIRVRKIVADFGETPVDTIKPANIDAWLSRVTKTPATSNRYGALFSLIFRENVRVRGLRNVQHDAFAVDVGDLEPAQLGPAHAHRQEILLLTQTLNPVAAQTATTVASAAPAA